MADLEKTYKDIKDEIDKAYVGMEKALDFFEKKNNPKDALRHLSTIEPTLDKLLIYTAEANPLELENPGYYNQLVYHIRQSYYFIFHDEKDQLSNLYTMEGSMCKILKYLWIHLCKIKKPKHYCHVCDKTYPRKQNLRMHMFGDLHKNSCEDCHNKYGIDEITRLLEKTIISQYTNNKGKCLPLV